MICSSVSFNIYSFSSSFAVIPLFLLVNDWARQVRVAKLTRRADAWGFWLHHNAHLRKMQSGESQNSLMANTIPISNFTETGFLL
jgi:hypothetical protein